MLVRWIAAIITFAVLVAAGVAVAGVVPASGEADPVTFAGVVSVVVLTAMVASAAPAWRAARVDPVTMFRAE